MKKREPIWETAFLDPLMHLFPDAENIAVWRTIDLMETDYKDYKVDFLYDLLAIIDAYYDALIQLEEEMCE